MEGQSSIVCKWSQKIYPYATCARLPKRAATNLLKQEESPTSIPPLPGVETPNYQNKTFEATGRGMSWCRAYRVSLWVLYEVRK